MIEYKQNSAARVPVRLLTVAGVAVTGVVYGGATVSVEKSDGSVVNFTPASSSDFVEVTSGAFTGVGKYDLVIPSADTNLAGPLVYVVKATGADPYVGAVNIVANLEDDTYTRIGTPVGASISADIATNATTLGTVNSGVSSANSALGTIGSAVGTIGSGVSSTNTSLSTLTTTVGTPVGVSIAADVDAIKAKTDNLPSNPASQTNLDVAVSTRSTYAGGAVASVSGSVGSVAGNVVGSVGSLATQAKTDVTAAVWDADMAAHETAGTTGSALSTGGIVTVSSLTVLLDHNYGGVNALAYIGSGSVPIAGATVTVYSDALYTVPLGSTTTNGLGHWLVPIPVSKGATYYIRFFLAYQYGPDDTSVAVPS